MLRQIALYKILGLPVAALGGIITLLLFLATAALGMLIMKGKIHAPISWHMNLARTAIVFALLHALLALSLFL